MPSFYEVPVTIELDEEEMCVYIKVYCNSASEAAEAAKELVLANMSLHVDEEDIIKI